MNFLFYAVHPIYKTIYSKITFKGSLIEAKEKLHEIFKDLEPGYTLKIFTNDEVIYSEEIR